MDSTESVATANADGRLTSRVSAIIFLTVAMTCVTLDLLANTPAVTSWMRVASWNLARDTSTVFSQTDHYIDFEDRLLHEELPRIDHSQGGIYVLGSSVLKWAFQTFDLPPEYQSRIHNVGIGATSSKLHLKLLRFLVEQEGILRAGGEKTLVVFGTSYFSVGHEGRFFYSIWNRHKQYEVTPDRMIRRVPSNRIARWWSIESVKVPGIAKELFQLAQLRFYKARKNLGFARDGTVSPEVYAEKARGLMTESWRERIAAEMKDLSSAIDYLRQRKVKCVVVLMPQGSWEDPLPFEQAYNDAVRHLCKTNHVPIYDFNSLLEDRDFADGLHLAPTGMEKFREAILPIFTNHLRSIGALSKP